MEAQIDLNMEVSQRGRVDLYLKIINDFLDKEIKSGNVNWLGNLGLAILNLNNSVLNFTKVGKIRILLVRDNELLDLSENLEFQDTEPDPMKVFKKNILLVRLKTPIAHLLSI